MTAGNEEDVRTSLKPLRLGDVWRRCSIWGSTQSQAGILMFYDAKYHDFLKQILRSDYSTPKHMRGEA